MLLAPARSYPNIQISSARQRLPAQYRRNPGAQDCRIERLSQVIVGAEFDAFRYFLSIRVGADHDDRNVSRIRVGFDYH